ncbi:GntR family transcriptional regulator [Frondihabitans cladoniiphilus]|uniref:HTH gntR-type domain-containing protein n=1 Tax=Frondihabitans cladoniiphilus TaxID=715785 RepID=A0ABP8W6V2_9MICO
MKAGPPDNPHWRAIARIVEHSITSGELPVGARLPTNPELAERHGVSKATIIQAKRYLITRGLIRAEQGVGTTVVSTVATIDSPTLTVSGPRDCQFVQHPASSSEAHIRVTVDSRLVGEIRSNVPWKAWKIKDTDVTWESLLSASGGHGCRRNVTIGLLPRDESDSANLLVTIDVQDDMANHSQRLTLVLDAAAFEVELATSAT